MYNTFQEGLAYTKPYMYNIMNRQQEALNSGRNNFLAAGAKPVQFTSKKVISYRPNWCSPGIPVYKGNLSIGQVNALAVTGVTPQYGWLSTKSINITTQDNAIDTNQALINDTQYSGAFNNATNNVTYNGHWTYLDMQTNNAPSNPIGRLVCVVTWKFKGAKSNYSAPVKVSDISGANP